MRATALAAAGPRITALRDPDLRQALDQLRGYDTTGAGTVRTLP